MDRKLAGTEFSHRYDRKGGPRRQRYVCPRWAVQWESVVTQRLAGSGNEIAVVSGGGHAGESDLMCLVVIWW